MTAAIKCRDKRIHLVRGESLIDIETEKMSLFLLVQLSIPIILSLKILLVQLLTHRILILIVLLIITLLVRTLTRLFQIFAHCAGIGEPKSKNKKNETTTLLT